MSKLKINNISKDNGKNISPTIKKIKSNESFYTTILVFIFMCLFIVLFYFTFRVSSDTLINKSGNTTSLYSSSRVITLTGNSIKPINNKIYISNNTNHYINYKIILSNNEDMTKKCGCSDRVIPLNNIRYKIFDNTYIPSLNSDGEIVIDTGSLKCGESTNVPISMWVADNTPSNLHFHAYFLVEEISK